MNEQQANEITFSHHFLERVSDLDMSVFQALQVVALGKMRRLEGGFLSFKYKGVEVIICPIRQLAVTLIKDELLCGKKRDPNFMTDYELAMCA